MSNIFQGCLKNGADKLAECMVVTSLQCVKEKQTKNQYLQSIIKQIEVKQNMSVISMIQFKFFF